MGPEIQASEAVLRHPWEAGIIFSFTFLLVSFRQMRLLPIGRPSSALLGAVLMVLGGVMSPEEAYRLVNWDTICLLLGMMIIAEHLRAAGMFERFSALLEGPGAGEALPRRVFSPFLLLALVSGSSALLSALLVNDTICVVMTPLVLELCANRRLDPFPFLMALATSSNIGSALTLTGNPQNMIIGSLSKLHFGSFMLRMAIPVLAAFLVNLFLLWLYYRARLSVPHHFDFSPAEGADPHLHSRSKPVVRERRLRIGLVAVLIACAGFFAGYSMAFSALAGAVVVITLHRKDPGKLLARLEWSLLLFFAALFVVIGGLKTSGLADLGTNWAMSFIGGTRGEQVGIFSLVTLAGSNLFSNVPFVLIASHAVEHLVPRDLFWCLLAYVSTLAGNLTLFGSVANLIVAESARGRCEMGFLEYAKFGIPSTILTLGAGLTLLYALS